MRAPLLILVAELFLPIRVLAISATAAWKWTEVQMLTSDVR